MTSSKHVYSAYLIGSPDIALRVKGGTITLDAGSSPHVSGTVTIAVPSLAVLTALDPRNSVRIRVEAAATFPAGTQARAFNLGLRGRSNVTTTGTVTLTLQSDEALLGDYRPLTDDAAPLGYQSSLRGLVGYLLTKAIPGATLNTSLSAADVAVPALADSQNLIRNPRAANNTTDWNATWTTGGITLNRQASGGPSDSPTYVYANCTSATTGGYVYLSDSVVSVTPGKLYELSLYVQGSALSVSLDAWILDQSSTIVGATSAATVTLGGWTRISVQFYGVTNAARLRPRLLINGTAASGTGVNLTGWRLSESTGDHDRDIQYFDGGFTDTAQYHYGFSQGAHASVSTRKTLIDAATPDALTLKAGQSALDFLTPIVQRCGLRLVCDETRTWTLRADGFSVPGLLSIRTAVNLIDSTDTISRDSGIWFDGAVTIHTWTGADGIQQRRVDAWALTSTPTLVQRFEKTTPYPGPGFSQYAVRRAQGRGREVTADTTPDWNAAAEQPAVIYLDSAPVQVGKSQRIVYDLDRDQMTVTTRTTDTPVGAIDLLASTINSLASTINSL